MHSVRRSRQDQLVYKVAMIVIGLATAALCGFIEAVYLGLVEVPLW